MKIPGQISVKINTQALHTDVNVLFQATTVIEPMVNGPYLVDANNTHVETIGIKHLDNVLTVA